MNMNIREEIVNGLVEATAVFQDDAERTADYLLNRVKVWLRKGDNRLYGMENPCLILADEIELMQEKYWKDEE